MTGPGVRLTIHLHGGLKKSYSREKFFLANPLVLVYKKYAKTKLGRLVLYSVLMGTVWALFGRNHARDCHVITHALSLIRVTRRLPSCRFLHTA
jgi:hypothetical protein